MRIGAKLLFFQKMKQLSVLRSGASSGEYVFNVRMVRVYIWLASRRSDDDRTV